MTKLKEKKNLKSPANLGIETLAAKVWRPLLRHKYGNFNASIFCECSHLKNSVEFRILRRLPMQPFSRSLVEPVLTRRFAVSSTSSKHFPTCQSHGRRRGSGTERTLERTKEASRASCQSTKARRAHSFFFIEFSDFFIE